MNVSLPHLLLAIVVLPFLWILLDHFLNSWSDRREIRRRQRAMRECHLCGKRYPEEKRVKVSTCPECAAQNVRGGHRKLG